MKIPLSTVCVVLLYLAIYLRVMKFKISLQVDISSWTSRTQRHKHLSHAPPYQKCCLIIAVKLNELEKDIDNILDWGIGDCKEMIQEILQAIHNDKAKKLHEVPEEEAQQAAEK